MDTRSTPCPEHNECSATLEERRSRASSDFGPVPPSKTQIEDASQERSPPPKSGHEDARLQTSGRTIYNRGHSRPSEVCTHADFRERDQWNSEVLGQISQSLIRDWLGDKFSYPLSDEEALKAADKLFNMYIDTSHCAE